MMKRYYILSIVFILSISAVCSQNTLNQIFEQIGVNNKTLKAARQAAQVGQIDARTGIYPSGLDIEYEQLWGDKSSGSQKESELTVKQGFDFPSSYYQKNKIASLKSEQALIQYNITRQDVLLEVKLLCTELVYYNKVKNLIKTRLRNAEELESSYQKRLASGDANILETNKIGLELLNVQNEYRLIEIEYIQFF